MVWEEVPSVVIEAIWVNGGRAEERLKGRHPLADHRDVGGLAMMDSRQFRRSFQNMSAETSGRPLRRVGRKS